MVIRMRKQALITAGSKNTGFGIAMRLAKEGFDVHITSRNLDSAARASEEIQQAFPEINAYPYSLELRSVSDIERVFCEIKAKTPKLDIFVANAADLGIGFDVYSTDEKAYDEVMDTNVKGTFFCCREAGRLMKDGGSMVLISSVHSKGSVEGRSLYGISKVAVNGICKHLAYDFAPYGIRVNAIIAGAIHTDRWDSTDECTAAARRKNYPLAREADIDEIAEAVCYLSSDSSKHVTGAEITVDSGVLLPILPYSQRKSFKRENY